MNQPMLVAAAIIRHKDKILIAQRKKGSVEEDKWEFPGGKIEFLEHPEDALIREIKEELNITISVDKLFTVASHIYGTDKKYHVILLVFFADYVEGEIEHLDVQDARWVALNELKEYEFTAADQSVIAELNEK